MVEKGKKSLKVLVFSVSERSEERADERNDQWKNSDDSSTESGAQGLIGEKT